MSPRPPVRCVPPTPTFTPRTGLSPECLRALEAERAAQQAMDDQRTPTERHRPHFRPPELLVALANLLMPGLGFLLMGEWWLGLLCCVLTLLVLITAPAATVPAVLAVVWTGLRAYERHYRRVGLLRRPAPYTVEVTLLLLATLVITVGLTGFLND